jgi:hypothetical protein
MKKFLAWYTLAVVAIAAVPSAVVALVVFCVALAGGMPDGASAAVAIAFTGTFIFIALSELYPALIILVVGVIICLVLSSNSSRR